MYSYSRTTCGSAIEASTAASPRNMSANRVSDSRFRRRYLIATRVPDPSCRASTTSPKPPEPSAFSSVYPGTLHPATPACPLPFPARVTGPVTIVSSSIGKLPFASAPDRGWRAAQKTDGCRLVTDRRCGQGWEDPQRVRIHHPAVGRLPGKNTAMAPNRDHAPTPDNLAFPQISIFETRECSLGMTRARHGTITNGHRPR